METLPPAVSRMNLEHLKTFHYVAQSGSFTRAAQLLFLTQPAVSQQMQGLENALHVALFDRSRRSIALTAEGEVLYGYTRRLFGLFDEIGQVFQDLSLLQAGTLTLAASAVMGSYYLPPLLRRFHKRFPQIRFNIRIGNSGQVFDWVAGQEAELGFAGRTRRPAQVEQTLLYREPYVVVTAAGSPLLDMHRPLRLDEFLQASVVVREKGTRTRAKIEEWVRKQGGKRASTAPLITVGSLEAARDLVAAGFGAAALPRLAVTDALARGTLVALAVENFALNADYYLLRPRQRKLSPAAMQFLHALPPLAE